MGQSKNIDLNDKIKTTLKIELNSERLKSIKFIAIHTTQFIRCQFNTIFYCNFFCFNSKSIPNEWKKRSLNCIWADVLMPVVSLWYELPPLFDCDRSRFFLLSMHPLHIFSYSIFMFSTIQLFFVAFYSYSSVWIETFTWWCVCARHNAISGQCSVSIVYASSNELR